jgi:hypothetical protein
MRHVTIAALAIVLLAVPLNAKTEDEATKVRLGEITWMNAFQTDDLRLAGGKMMMTSFGFDPYIMSQDVNIDASDVKTIRIRMSLTRGTNAQLFFEPWAEERSVPFTVIPDGRMHEYVLNVAEHPGWKGTIKRLRFDPCQTPMSEIVIEEITPSEQPPKPDAAIWTTLPEKLIVTRGTAVPLPLAVVNTGGTDLEDISVYAVGEKDETLGRVESGDLAPLVLPAGQVGSMDIAAKLITEKAGETAVALRVARGEPDNLLVSRRVGVSVVDPAAVKGGAPDEVIKFSTPGGNSDYVLIGGEASEVETSEDAIGIAIEIDGRAEIVFDRELTLESNAAWEIKGLTGSGTQCMLYWRTREDVRYAAAFALGEEPVMLPASPGRVTLERLVLSGQGGVQLESLKTSTTTERPPFIHGEGFYRNPLSNVEGYIKEIRTPLIVEVPGSEESVTVALELIEDGEWLTGERIPPKTFQSKGGKVEVLLDSKADIGWYEMTVSSHALARPFKRHIAFVESRVELEKMRQKLETSIYGPPRGEASEEIEEFAYPNANPAVPYRAMLGVYESDLVPAWLLDVRMREVAVFERLSEIGLGQPSHIAVPTKDGVKVFGPKDEDVDAQLSEPWMLAWFAGSKNWKLWDTPVLLVLQHRPTGIERKDDHVELSFRGRCDKMVFMPLYGYYRPPQKGEEILSRQDLEERGIETWTWSEALPEEVEERCRFFSRAMLKFPIDCHETFNVDPAAGTLTVRQTYDYITIKDDWKTEPITLAPVSPTLGFTQIGPKDFPIAFEQDVTDPDMMTPYGPWMFVKDSDTVTWTVSDLVDIVNETEVQFPLEGEPIPAVEKAMDIAQASFAARFQSGPRYMVEFDRKSFVWAQLAEHAFGKGIAYATPEASAHMQGSYANYYSSFFFGTQRRPADGDRGWWIPTLKDKHPKLRHWYAQNTVCIDGPGIHGGLFGDSGKISASAAYNVWSYAHYAGDWGIAARRWDFLRRCNTNAVNMDWKAMGRMSNAETGEHARPMLAFARLAYLAGDMDNYYYGVYCFVRELLMLHVKMRQVGGVYFRDRQPYTNYEAGPMPKWALPNHVLGEAAGWIVDATEYTPIEGRFRGSEVQTDNRWVRFSSEDVARFWREHLREQITEELEAKRSGEFKTHVKPVFEKASYGSSLIRLYSYMLDTPAEKLAELFPPEEWNWRLDNNGSLMMALSVVRAAVPREYNRLIPRDCPPSGFVTGLPRQPVTCGWRGLLMFTWPEKEGVDWPRARWYRRGGSKVGTKTPHFSFGRIAPISRRNPRETETRQLNWTTKLTIYR